MITDYSNVRAVRPIAENMVDEKRLRPYIEEAETLWLIPATGAALYKKLSDALLMTNKETPITNDSNQKIFIQNTGWLNIELLFNGGYYDNDKRYFAGLNAAMGYLSYSRFVRNQNVNNTAFGLTIKRGEFSEPAGDKTIVRIANDAEKIGYEYLNQCIEYLKHEGVLPCGAKKVKHQKIKAIGD